MDDVLLVRRLDAVDQLPHDRERLVERHRPGQVLALDVLEHEVIGADVIEMTDVRVIQRGIDRASREKRSENSRSTP